MSPAEARQRLEQLETDHGPRCNWVWARLGMCPLANALEQLAMLAKRTATTLGGDSADAMATHPEAPNSPEQIKRFVRYGASPRAMQALILAGRAYALLCGRAWVCEDDIRAIAHPVLRHRMIPTFDAKLESITNNHLVDTLIAAIPNLRAA